MPPSFHMLFDLHAAATWAMAGIIWFVQVAHYPLMDRVDRAGFAAFQHDNTRRTGRVVIPPMLAEAATAIALAATGYANPLFRASLLLLAIAWLSTFAVQVPLHRALARGFDDDAHRRLVLTNWVRTAAWTGRAILVAAAAGSAMEPAV